MRSSLIVAAAIAIIPSVALAQAAPAPAAPDAATPAPDAASPALPAPASPAPDATPPALPAPAAPNAAILAPPAPPAPPPHATLGPPSPHANVDWNANRFRFDYNDRGCHLAFNFDFKSGDMHLDHHGDCSNVSVSPHP
jgi:hypothetical protein